MSDVAMQRASLWREGLKSFSRNWRGWLLLASIFFVISAVSNGALLHVMEPLQDRLKDVQAQSPKDPHAVLALLAENGPSLAGWYALMIIIMYAEYYLFMAFFLEKELPSMTAKPSGREFFCFLGKNIQMILIVASPMVLAGVAMSITGAVMLAMKVKAGNVFPLIMVAASLPTAYLGIRLCLVQPLAAGKIKAPIKTSWAMTHGNCWRLFGNIMLLVLLLLVAGLLFYIISFLLGLIMLALGKIFDAQGVDFLKLFARYVVHAAVQVVTGGIFCAYLSAACRVLYQEKKESDPTFTLTTRS